MIIWIASFPRSGNTLYRMLLYQLFGIHTFSAHNDPEMFREGFADMVGHTKLPVASRRWYDHGKKPDKRITALNRSEKLYMVKIHRMWDVLPFKAPSVYVVRDGRDAEVSFAHFISHTYGNRTPLEVMTQRIKGGKTKWGDHVMSYKGHGPFVRYEDMLTDPVGSVGASLAALGIKQTPMKDADIPSFEKLQTKCPWFFRKGKSGAWKEEMPPELEAIFWRRFGKAMEAYGYER